MRSVTCVSCGLVGWADGGACKRCGKPLPEVSRQAPRGAQPPQQDYTGYNYNAGQSYNAGQDYNAGYNAGYNYAYTPDYSDANAKKRKGHAVASLVIGVLGLFTFGIVLIGSIVGTILGIVAMKKQSSAPAVYGGRGLAIAGVVVNILGLVMVVPIGIVAAIAIPNLLASRRAANEASAIRTLRTIAAAEDTYRATAGAGKYADINQLAAAGLIEKQLLSGPKHDYVFNVTVSGGDFDATATPTADSSNARSFCVSSANGGSGIRFRNDGQPARRNDPMLDFNGSSRQRIVSGIETRSPATAPAY
jgi:type II secretory pathway pseudopilin PulG